MILLYSFLYTPIPKACLAGGVYQSDSLLCVVLAAEGDEGISSVLARQRVHHQTQVPDGTRLLEEGNQLVFVQVTRDLPHENL